MRFEIDVQPIAANGDYLGAQRLEESSPNSSTLVGGVDRGIEDEGM